MAAEIVALSARELAARVRVGELRAREVIEAHARHIETTDARVGAFLRTTFERAYAGADAFSTWSFSSTTTALERSTLSTVATPAWTAGSSTVGGA